MTKSHLPLIAGFLLAIPCLAQQNPTPPLYPAAGNAADAQSQQNVCG